MKPLTLLLALASTISVVTGRDLPFTAEDCGRPDRSVIFRSFDIGPKPLELHLQTDLNVKVNMDVKQVVGPGVRANVKVQKVMGRWNVPLLSINKNFCDFLKDVTFSQILCPLFSSPDGTCACPIEAGSYQKDAAKIHMDLNKLPVPRMLYRLGSGNWQMEVRVTRDSREIGCLRIRSHVKIQV